MRYDWQRELGDSICQVCPKWDAEAKKPRPTLGTHDLGLVALLREVQSTGCLPAIGGILDQDPELMDLLAVIAASAWYAEMTG